MFQVCDMLQTERYYAFMHAVWCFFFSLLTGNCSLVFLRVLMIQVYVKTSLIEIISVATGTNL